MRRVSVKHEAKLTVKSGMCATGLSSGVSSVLMDGHIDDINIRIYNDNWNASFGLPVLYGSTVNSLFALMLR